MRGGFPRAYDPKTSGDFKARVAFFAKECGVSLRMGPVRVVIDVFVKRPKRLGKASDFDGPVICDKRPDWDNFGKSVSDALTGIAWADDGQICDGRVRKWYHEKVGTLRTRIEIEGAVEP